MAWRDCVLFPFGGVGLISYQYRCWDVHMCKNKISLADEVTPSILLIDAAVTPATDVLQQESLEALQSEPTGTSNCTG
jgi:hypothetical protein